MNLGSKITELRKQKGWSQSELAKKLVYTFLDSFITKTKL
mgnify:CR=1 FL=1